MIAYHAVPVILFKVHVPEFIGVTAIFHGPLTVALISALRVFFRYIRKLGDGTTCTTLMGSFENFSKLMHVFIQHL